MSHTTTVQTTESTINPEFLTEIENTEATDADVAAAAAFLARFTYTGTALVALHMAMRALEQDMGDENTDGSAILLHAASDMCKVDAAVA